MTEKSSDPEFPLDEKIRQARNAQVAAREAANVPEGWWWLSFAMNGFLGVCIVRGHGVVSASLEAHRLGI